MTLYHDYKPSEMEDFLESVTEIAIPVYVNLSSELFAPYVYEYEKTVALDGIKRADVINTLYDVYKECNPTLGEIYSYMLQHGLYDVDTANGHRFNGSFTTYIDSNASPYLFATIEGTMLDYATLAHEFGHFADGYINNDSATSLDLTEVSSQALELLTILALEDRLDEESYKYLLYLKLEEILSTIIFQSFYASFEIAAYELDYEDITLENLNALVASVAKEFGFSSSCNNVGYVTIPHIFIYPFYVQSYATSAITALEIYTAEVKHEGAGFEKYTDLITRESDEILSFDEELEASYLSSPFDSGAFKKILNELHYATIGAYFYKTQGGNAA